MQPVRRAAPLGAAASDGTSGQAITPDQPVCKPELPAAPVALSDTARHEPSWKEPPMSARAAWASASERAHVSRLALELRALHVTHVRKAELAERVAARLRIERVPRSAGLQRACGRRTKGRSSGDPHAYAESTGTRTPVRRRPASHADAAPASRAVAARRVRRTIAHARSDNRRTPRRRYRAR